MFKGKAIPSINSSQKVLIGQKGGENEKMKFDLHVLTNESQLSSSMVETV